MRTYTLNSDIIIEPADDAAVLVNTKDECVYVLNSSAYILLKSILNSDNISEATELYYAETGYPHTDIVKNDFDEFLNYLLSEKLLSRLHGEG